MSNSATAPPRTPRDSGILERRILRRVLSELRWSFKRPWTWLAGVALNLALSLLWLLWVPLRGQSHGDWVILVGTYFAVFIMADVTTTNVLGLDAGRVRGSLERGVTLGRILVPKNLALLMIVGLPTLVFTAVLTARSETANRLVLTLPGVALPMLAWLGVGNLVSVLLPVATKPVRQRWRERHDPRRTARWLAHLVLPYALLYAVDPVGDTPGAILRELPRRWHTIDVRGLVIFAFGLLIWVCGTAAATYIARHRGLPLK